MFGGKMKKIKLLSMSNLKKVLTLREIINVVEKGFISDSAGEIDTYPVVMESIAQHNAFFGIKSCYIPSVEAVGLKMGGFWPPEEGSTAPAHFAVIFLVDGTTGEPLAFMDGNLITTWRTGAAGAIGAKYLARPDSSKVGVIGAGVQGQIQVQALQEVFKLTTVNVWDPNPKAVQNYIEVMADRGLEIQAASDPAMAVDGVDIIVTATPSRQVLVKSETVKPGMHVNAIGADARGKNEVDPHVFTKAKVVVDKLSQCVEMGDLQHPIKQGLITTRDVHAELGEIISGNKPGRTSKKEITLFDATGVSFQDLITARLAYERAVDAGLGTDFIIEE
jgi:alanine dehydrogenase